MSKNIEDVLAAYADSFGIKDSDKTHFGSFLDAVAQATSEGFEPAGQSGQGAALPEVMDAEEGEFGSPDEGEEDAEGDGDKGDDERQAKDFESDEEDIDQDDEEPVEPKTPKRNEDTPKRNENKQEPKAEQPKGEEPECEGCKERDIQISLLEADLNAEKEKSADLLNEIKRLRTAMSEKDADAQKLRDRLTKKSMEIQHKADDIGKLKAELTRREDEESLNVPEGMTWITYLESLERKIGAFEQFIKSDKRVAFSFNTGSTSKCRHCGHIFVNGNSEEARLNPRMHNDGCPLKTALAR